ncbi:hypothetical protein D0962_33955 [Leptolyngbyaceae cyanobacterium CCMR0082]|uniref:Glycosyl hydrolase family 13 catalytic domain-containing protein n=1 Tax=Adonisia turfae CCMR0082 TaxID=2304604 RepID=A0A6M0SGM8_9CYAN|nr:alpha-amylase family glycosyl hydrolase [Adonisia turfae]NEZ67709.1 hypothetical protein [Adonisia turfae CCMR0082]
MDNVIKISDFRPTKLESDMPQRDNSLNREQSQKTNPWWKSCLIYEIIPDSFIEEGSFQDLIDKLDYVKFLGADILYLTPITLRPEHSIDAGYDVTDHKSIDPRYGNWADFERLVNEASKQNIRVMVDLVLSHTSKAHFAFVASRDPNHPEHDTYKDWYVWENPGSEGKAPNNWPSYFGTPQNPSAWTYDERRQQYYLHNFDAGQPDLNMWNPQVQSYVLDVIRFWQEKGADMRLDVVNCFFHDRSLKNASPRAESTIPDGCTADNPMAAYDLSYLEQSACIEFMKACRKAAGTSVVLAEVALANDSIELASYYVGEDKAHMAYSGSLLRNDILSAEHLNSVLQRIQQYFPKGGFCVAIGNHDFSRVTSRLFSEAENPAAASVQYMKFCSLLPGSFINYYGDEWGQKQTADAESSTVKYAQPGLSHRNGARSRPDWSAVAEQISDTSSPLFQLHEHYLWRKQQPAIQSGQFKVLELEKPLVGFVRSAEKQVLAAVFNTSNSVINTGLGFDVEPYQCMVINSSNPEHNLFFQAVLPTFGRVDHTL